MRFLNAYRACQSEIAEPSLKVNRSFFPLSLSIFPSVHSSSGQMHTIFITTIRADIIVDIIFKMFHNVVEFL